MHLRKDNVLCMFNLYLLQEAFQAFHKNSIEHVRKFLKPLRIGKLADSEEIPDLEIKEDFAQLEKTADKMVSSTLIYTLTTTCTRDFDLI